MTRWSTSTRRGRSSRPITCCRIVNLSTGLTRFAIAALVSEENRWVNAQRLEISGGMFL